MFELDQRRFNRLALGAMLLGFLLLAGAFGAALVSQAIDQRSNQWVQHTFRVVDELSRLDLAVERSETAARGYVIRPDVKRRQTFQQNRDLFAPALDSIGRETSDNPVQTRTIARLIPMLADERDTLNRIIALTDQRGADAAQAALGIEMDKRRLNAIRAVLAEMRAEELRLLRIRIGDAKRASGWSQLALLVTGLLLGLLGLVTFLTVRRYTGQLEGARARVDQLNAGLEARVRERTAELRRVNAELQRFAYIVSHDLRSPLVNIMGFTAELDTSAKALTGLIDKVDAEAPQLVDEPARLAAREDLPEAVSFIRASTQKMDRLINAILRLSREGRRNLRPERLDLGEVIPGIARTFEQQLSALDASVEVGKRMPVIEQDRVVIEQIVSNLVDNALKYGVERGGHIRVGAVTRGPMTEISVSDDGRGIDPKDHERIFDLFRRAGKQDVAGEGLGLAHVRALAYRLGGSIDVSSQVGQGATFRLVIPTIYREQEPEA
ncbi:CHASE3 domain-containing protein [Sphingomonas sp. KRR8]|uniref:sensor histidine kinase n=1 Tax=Sphingomonas sp. KRR8 TaxID=2942996 RepID=UPI0020223068|nr:sensor histidine kinase [Sphingomonas sp. KRR8]URD59785.1 CHASE3 domain-containing protein [Sphingomonas sp. KRR8]